MKLFRSRGGAWQYVAEPSFVEGDRLRVDLRHGHDREIFVYLFDIGLTGKVTLLFPDLDGHEVLDSGTVLTIGARRGDALEMFLPDGLPVNCSNGVGYLLLVGAESRLSTTRLQAGSVGPPCDSVDAVSACVSRYSLHRE